MATKRKQAKKKTYRLLLVIILFTVISFLTVNTYQQRFKSDTDSKIFQESSQSEIFPTAVATPKPGGPLEYKRYGFNLTDEKHKKTPYPDVMRNLSDTDLYEFSCTDRFAWGQLLTEDELGKKISVPISSQKRAYSFNSTEEAGLLKSAAQVGNFDAKIISGTTICYGENGDLLFVVLTTPKPKSSSLDIVPKVFAGGGGGWDAYVFQLIRSSSVPRKIAYIPFQNAAYWGCGTVYAITKYDIAYMECGGGDGGVSSTDLYQVNLASFSAEKILHCQSGFNSQQESVWSCY